MKSSLGFTVYLAGLSMLGFLATDMYLPAFESMQVSLGSNASAIGATLSIFLAGFAIAQLVWGPLSDRLGRRPILLAGILLFTIASFGCVFVTSTTQLLVLRFIQAVGVCAAAVSWQALVVDRFEGNEANRMFATIMPLVALSPALAPLMGVWLLEHFSWRAIFVALGVIGILLLLCTLRLQARGAQPSTQKSVSYMTILQSTIFSGNALIFAACSAAFFAWLTGSPFILGELGYSPRDIGLSYIPQTIAFLAGGYGCRTLLTRTTGKKMLPWLLGLFILSVGMLYIIPLTGYVSLLLLMIPFCLLAVANGAIYPIVVSNALAPWKAHTGRAAALQNAIQLGLSFLASMMVSWQAQNALIATTQTMLIMAMLVLVGYFLQGVRAKNSATKPSQASSQ
ncbi:purine nucleoside transporter PunC [Plesiomonas sp.]|uniref:purine nucleoside transporter PunC n=1 Tax=Plesiomonas sp. TaxID=2486279 RepID=UPI003F2D13F2